MRSFFFYTDQPNGGSYTGFRLTVTDFVITDYSQNGQDRYDTDQITGAIEGQTDEILGALDGYMNDYESPRPGMEDEVQGAEDDYNSAVDDALGGKSDEEIQQEADAAADYDFDSLDQGSISGVQSFMDGLLDVLGPDYLSLLLFSCTMGLCIYVIGRKRGT